MDADTVKQVEFSRKMRGYDMGQVDAFLEDLEATLRRQSLERESMQHRLDELSGARDAQSERLSILNGQLLLTKEENQHLTERVAQLEKELEEKNARLEREKAFVDEHTAYVSFDGTGLYHCSDCVYFDRTSFTVYDVNTAKARGLTPCEYCHSAEETP